MAVPVPVPTSVAVNTTPIVFDAAPINVKSVVPTVVIVYFLLVTKSSALIKFSVDSEIT